MNAQGPVRNLNGKPAVFVGVIFAGVSAALGDKVVVIVDERLRLLAKSKWEGLTSWAAPQPLPPSNDSSAPAEPQRVFHKRGSYSARRSSRARRYFHQAPGGQDPRAR